MVAQGSIAARKMWRQQQEEYGSKIRLWESTVSILHTLDMAYRDDRTTWLTGSEIARRAGVDQGYASRSYLPGLVRMRLIEQAEAAERTGHQGGGRWPIEYRITLDGRRLVDIL